MSGQNAIKMLSIDDRTVTTDLDRAGYRKMGVYVRCAINYEEAMKLLGAEPIDLIVINMDYKPIDAAQIAKHIKTHTEFKHVPIVLTSVQTAAKVRNSALDAGADLFVEQPLPRQYFIEKLKQLLEQKTRTTERVGLAGEVNVNAGGQKFVCPIGDLSVSGILLSTDIELADGTSVALEFEIPENKKPLQIDGEVVRTIKYSNKFPDRQTGIGIRFVDFRGDSQKRLEQYINKSTGADSHMRYYL